MSTGGFGGIHRPVEAPVCDWLGVLPLNYLQFVLTVRPSAGKMTATAAWSHRQEENKVIPHICTNVEENC